MEIIQQIIEDQSEEDGSFATTLDVHVESLNCWCERSCLCSISPKNQETSFLPLNNVRYTIPVLTRSLLTIKILKKNFGLEAIIIHEALSEIMQTWNPEHSYNNRSLYNDIEPYYTTCYLTPAFRDRGGNRKNLQSSYASNALFSRHNDFAGIYQTVDSALLSISDEERCRFV